MDAHIKQQALIGNVTVGPKSPLVLVEHVPDVLGEAHGFGGFLFDLEGKLIVENGTSWLYTTQIVEGKWESWTRPFNLKTKEAGSARRVLLPVAEDDRAVLHHIVAIEKDLIVGFYCNGVGIGVAAASAPDANFIQDPAFIFKPEVGWETRRTVVDGWSLESNGAYVLCEDTAKATVFWQGYDSYRRDGRLGDLGWAKIRVDKRSRRAELLGRHPNNPLAFRKADWQCARCGGNLSSDVRIAGKRAFFYYLRPNESQVFIGLALSADPLFISKVEHFIVDVMIGEEEVAEKFQAVQMNDALLLFYESRLKNGSWRTGLRHYKFA